MSNNLFETSEYAQGEPMCEKIVCLNKYAKKQYAKNVENKKNNIRDLKKLKLETVFMNCVLLSMLFMCLCISLYYDDRILFHITSTIGCVMYHLPNTAMNDLIFLILLNNKKFVPFNAVLLPKACGLPQHMVAKMYYFEYIEFLELFVKRNKRDFKRLFRSWCIRTHDRRFNKWSSLWKAFNAGRFIMDSDLMYYELKTSNTKMAEKIYNVERKEKRQTQVEEDCSGGAAIHRTDTQSYDSMSDPFYDFTYNPYATVEPDVVEHELSVYWDNFHSYNLVILLLRACYNKDYMSVLQTSAALCNDKNFMSFAMKIAPRDFDFIRNYNFQRMFGDMVTENFVDSELFKSLYKFISLLASSSMLSLFSTDMIRLVSETAARLRDIKSLSKIFSALVEFLTCFHERVRIAWNSGEFFALFGAVTLAEWRIKTVHYNGLSPKDESFKQVLGVSTEERIEQGVELLKAADKFESELQFSDRLLRKQLCLRIDKFRNLLKTQNIRKQPLGIILLGSPGGGKSDMATKFSYWIRAHRKEMDQKGDYYEIPFNDKHWNGCEIPLVINFNDLGGSPHDSNSELNVPDTLRRAVDINPFWTPQASIEDKANNVIDPVIVVVTTNDYCWDFSKLGTNWEKLIRRYPIIYRIKTDNFDFTNMQGEQYVMSHRSGKMSFDPVENGKKFTNQQDLLEYLKYDVVIPFIDKPDTPTKDFNCPLLIRKEDHLRDCRDQNCPYAVCIASDGTRTVVLKTELVAAKHQPLTKILGVSRMQEASFLKRGGDVTIMNPVAGVTYSSEDGNNFQTLPSNEITDLVTEGPLEVILVVCQGCWAIGILAIGHYVSKVYENIKFHTLRTCVDISSKVDQTLQITKGAILSGIDRIAEIWDMFLKILMGIISLITAAYLAKNYIFAAKEPSSDEKVLDAPANPVKLTEADIALSYAKPAYAKAQAVKDAVKFPTANTQFMFLSKHMNAMNYDDLRARINSNVHAIVHHTSDSMKWYGYGLFLSSDLFVTNFHIYHELISKKITTVTLHSITYPQDGNSLSMDQESLHQNGARWVADLTQSFVIPQRDLVFIKTPITTNNNLLGHIPTQVGFKTSGHVGPHPLAFIEATGQYKGQIGTTNYDLESLWTYSTHYSGLCGNPLIGKTASGSPQEHGIILGIHAFASTRLNVGYAVPIYKALVDKAIFQLKCKGFVNINFDLNLENAIPRKIQGMMVVPDSTINRTPMSYVGSSGNCRQKQSKSTIKPTEFHDDLIENMEERKVVPTLEKTGFLDLSNYWISPLSHKLTAFPRVYSFSQDLIDAAVDDFLKDRPMPFQMCGPLPLSQAVNGVQGDPFIKPINWQSSLGSARFYYKNKKDLVDNCEVDADLLHVLELIKEQHEQGRFFAHQQRWVLKDEPVTLKKQAILKYRYFMVSEMAPLLYCRMMLLPIIRHLYQNANFFEAQGGLNPASTKFGELAAKIKERLFFIMADIKSMDSSHKNFIAEAVAKIFTTIAKDLGYCDKDIQRVHMCVIETVFSMCDINGDWYKFVEGMGSGLLVTFIFNCLVLSILYRCAWIQLYKIQKWQLVPFRSRNTLICGGDDSAMGTDEEKFNMIWIISVFLSLGYKMTPAVDKDGEIKPFDDKEEFVFLKRTPVETSQGIIGQLALDSILKNLCFVLPSKTEPLVEQMYQKVDAAVRELALHPPEVFDKYIAYLKPKYPKLCEMSQEFLLHKYFNDELYDGSWAFPEILVSDDLVTEGPKSFDLKGIEDFVWEGDRAEYRAYLQPFFRLGLLVTPLKCLFTNNDIYGGDLDFMNIIVRYSAYAEILFQGPLAPFYFVVAAVLQAPTVEEAYFRSKYEKIVLGVGEFCMYLYNGFNLIPRLFALNMHLVCANIENIKYRIVIHTVYNWTAIAFSPVFMTVNLTDKNKIALGIGLASSAGFLMFSNPFKKTIARS